MLGDIELDVYQLPDGKYRMSATQVTTTVNKHAKSMWEFLEGKSPQALPHKGSNLGKIKAEGVKNAISEVTLEVASAYWAYWATKGDSQALALVIACVTEALERRADYAFGVARTEQERNDRLIARRDGILQRHFWTDSVKEYIDTHETTNEYRRYIYANVSDCLNQSFFGMSAKQIREEYNIPNGKALRDCVKAEYLADITFVEKYAGTLVKNGSEPLDAIRDALIFIGVQPKPFN